MQRWLEVVKRIEVVAELKHKDARDTDGLRPTCHCQQASLPADRCDERTATGNACNHQTLISINKREANRSLGCIMQHTNKLQHSMFIHQATLLDHGGILKDRKVTHCYGQNSQRRSPSPNIPFR